jgi:hypothetical protein
MKSMGENSVGRVVHNALHLPPMQRSYKGAMARSVQIGAADLNTMRDARSIMRRTRFASVWRRR